MVIYSLCVIVAKVIENDHAIKSFYISLTRRINYFFKDLGGPARNKGFGLNLRCHLGYNLPVKNTLYTLALILSFASPAMAQSDSSFSYPSKNIQIEDFKATNLPGTCSNEAQSIYTFSKNLYTTLQSSGSSSCTISVSITYNDEAVRQATFDKTKQRENSKIIAMMDLYASNSCTKKSAEATWHIKQGNGCQAMTYVQGQHVASQNGTNCSLNQYLQNQKDWLEQTLMEALQL